MPPDDNLFVPGELATIEAQLAAEHFAVIDRLFRVLTRIAVEDSQTIPTREELWADFMRVMRHGPRDGEVVHRIYEPGLGDALVGAYSAVLELRRTLVEAHREKRVKVADQTDNPGHGGAASAVSPASPPATNPATAPPGEPKPKPKWSEIKERVKAFEDDHLNWGQVALWKAWRTDTNNPPVGYRRFRKLPGQGRPPKT
jgi:hypothetical protein